MKVIDPLKFSAMCWPDVQFYKQQKEIIYSLVENVETVVPAGNMLGKDFVAAFLVLWFFISRNPCKIICTSVKERHLNVLWGEIDKFIRSSKYPLETKQGGLLVFNEQSIKKVVNNRLQKDSYVMKLVANDQSAESFQGHHVTPESGQPYDGLPRTLFLCDESSGVPDSYYRMAKTWAKRIYIFGNTWHCNNFFRRAVEGNPETKDPGGDLKLEHVDGYLRKVIRIRGEDSPNVRYGQALVDKYGEKVVRQKKMLKELIPGVLSYEEYKIRRATWSAVEQCVSLDAEFYAGAEELLYPSEWLQHSAQLAEGLSLGRKGKFIGVDAAEGGDNTCWAAIDDIGVIAIISKKTPNTSIIPEETIAFAKYHGVQASDVYFDLGGGGKEHVDRLATMGFSVKGVRFGASPTPEPKMSMTMLPDRVKRDDTRYVYLNRRVEMYALLSMAMNPDTGPGFAIPAKFTELRRQLSPIPKLWDKEGRLYLPPKNKSKISDDEVTMRTLIGCSPDEADALVLAVFGWKRGKMLGGGGVAF